MAKWQDGKMVNKNPIPNTQCLISDFLYLCSPNPDRMQECKNAECRILEFANCNSIVNRKLNRGPVVQWIERKFPKL